MDQKRFSVIASFFDEHTLADICTRHRMQFEKPVCSRHSTKVEHDRFVLLLSILPSMVLLNRHVIRVMGQPDSSRTRTARIPNETSPLDNNKARKTNRASQRSRHCRRGSSVCNGRDGGEKERSGGYPRLGKKRPYMPNRYGGGFSTVLSIWQLAFSELQYRISDGLQGSTADERSSR